MTAFKLAIRNLFFHKALNSLLFAGIVLATAILSGSLIVGDSVNYSLDRIASERLGKAAYAVRNDGYFFTDTLAERLREKLNTNISSMIVLQASLSFNDITTNKIEVYGYDEYFFGDIDESREGDEEIIINEKLASKMSLKKGDDAVLRMERLTLMPKDTPFSKTLQPSVSRRFKVRMIADASMRGNFSLKNNQVIPDNIFINKKYLEKYMGLYDAANLILIDGSKNINPMTVETALKASIKTDDAGFLIIEKKTGENILNSGRIFIGEKVPGIFDKTGIAYVPVFTYFANNIGTSKKSSNYFFISGVSGYRNEKGLDDDGIIISGILAKEIGAIPGSDVEIGYYSFDGNFNFSEKTAGFTVRSVKDQSFFEQDLTPRFPGFAESENCGDWAPSIPIDLKKISKKDEVYWAEYKATPKALISYEAARKLWKNGYGALTSLRFDRKKYPAGEIEKALASGINHEDYGIELLNLKNADGTESTVDFAGLFLSLSFFVITACLLLIVILAFFSIESRNKTVMVFRALGYSKGLIVKIFAIEWMLLALCGSIAGSFIGIVFSNAVLSLVRTVWIDIVGTADIFLDIRTASLILSAFTGFVISMLTVTAVLIFNSRERKHNAAVPSGIMNALSQNKILPFLASLLAVSLFLSVFLKSDFAFAFFINGLLTLVLCNFTIYRFFSKGKKAVKKISAALIGTDNIRMNRTKSILISSVLSISIFLLVSIGINQRIDFDVSGNANGTGGYKYLLDFTVPVSIRDAGRMETAEDAPDIVKIRIKEGDDISCLNLNRASDYSLYGIDPEEFIRRGSFKFAGAINRDKTVNNWELLNADLEAGEIPAIADQTVITWSLGKKLGDVLEIKNEKGEVKKLKLVASLQNSIFQGNIIISEKNLKSDFPSVSGYNMFLVDTDDGGYIGEVSKKFRENGTGVMRTADFLSRFYSVESTYISIFFVLGIFSFILGSAGICILIIKNMVSRKRELAVLSALGFGKAEIFAVVFFEYGIIYISGILSGLISAFIALQPQYLADAAGLSVTAVLTVIGAVAFSGFLLITVSILFSVPGNPVQSLRNQ